MNFKKNIFNLIIVALLVGVSLVSVLLYKKINKLDAQVSYTSDNTAVILSDVQTMQDNIKATLEEEASLISEWKITLMSANFDDMTYTVYVEVIPKEYTDTTVTKVYFGTNEIKLYLDGIKFVGEATLPFEESYEGNVTFLFEDGNKRSTEVLDDYEGVTKLFDNVVSGVLSDEPTLEDNNIKLDTTVDLSVVDKGYFDFSKYELILEDNGTVVRSYDVYELITESQEDTEDSVDDEDKVDDTEQAEEEDGPNQIEGTVEIEDSVPILNNDKIRIYLRIQSEQGFVFTYDLFGKTINADSSGFVEDEVEDDDTAGTDDSEDDSIVGTYTIIDSQENKYVMK